MQGYRAMAALTAESVAAFRPRLDAGNELLSLLSGIAAGNDAALHVVTGLAASWHPVGRTIQLRRWHRVPVQIPIIVTAWEEDGAATRHRRWTGLMRDVSPGGLSFTHASPISCRRVAVLVDEDESKKPAGVIVRLSWCRFTKSGVYQSGGAAMRSLSDDEVARVRDLGDAAPRDLIGRPECPVAESGSRHEPATSCGV